MLARMQEGAQIDWREQVVTRKDGTRLRCFTAGEGPTVVLAHGYLGDHSGFDLVAPRLVNAGRRVLLFDQRAHGGSSIGTEGLSPRAMASDYAALLEDFDVRQGVLVGHSMGAFLSVVFSILHADVARARLRGLVLVSGHAGGVAEKSPQNRVQIAMARFSLTRRLIVGTRTSARLMARTMFGDVADSRFVTETAEQLRRADIEATLPILEAQIAESYYDRLGEIRVGAIVICGERDRTCPRFHSERLGTQIRGARNVWLPRVGHMVIYEAPDVIVDAVEEHLRAGGEVAASVGAS